MRYINIKLRVFCNLHLPAVNLTKFHKWGIYISGIKVFNHFPQSLTILANDEKSFKSTLRKFLNHHSFYSMHEYYQHMEDEGVL
jgi:hypothetical protein